MKNGWWGATPSTWNFGSNWPRWSENADFQLMFARSASAVTPSEKVTVKPRIHDTTRCTTGCTTGCIVYTQLNW